MAIRVYNTLSKTKEPFEPVVPGRVGMYLCGPTVYKPSHIGHMVGPVIFDVIKRHLRYSGYDVTFVVNITDVDDKLIKESRERGVTMAQVAEEMTADYMQNLAAVGVDTIDHFPTATGSMDGIINFIVELIDKGFAYATPSGDVYFDVSRDQQYGKLSGRKPADMQGEGGEHAGEKRSPLDFALWKSAKAGEPSWKSPWGEGRPGWHIECSAMSRQLLGKTFDIHGGGLDLQFPHHENEIAQSECCHGAPQAKYWLHNGLVQATDEVGKVGGRATRGSNGDANANPAVGDQSSQEAGKIGKSKGAQAFRELLAEFPGETIRYFVISTHYRRPITFSMELIEDAGTALEAFYRVFDRFTRVTGQSFYELSAPATRSESTFDAGGDAFLGQIGELRTEILEALDDDFNTGEAIGLLQKFIRLVNRSIEQDKLESPDASPEAKAKLTQAMVVLRELTGILGLFREPVAQDATSGDTLVEPLMQLLIEIRGELRKAKNFQLADVLRNRLTDLGITLVDRPTGTEWERS